ncbi:MAG: gluconokinase [Anaerolineaceae bacterium]|nr:gluconokinase [Anaerolineaceae bacterium]
MAIVLMGVAGCGKTLIGRTLSQAIGWPFYDGDDYHPQANIEKMSHGVPLNDDDRQPWLEELHTIIREHLERGQDVILACSALKAKYRQTLRGDLQNVRFVHLVGSPELIYERLVHRNGHYMKAEMLKSQFAALERPKEALSVSIDQPVKSIVAEIVERLNLEGAGN